MCRNCPAAQLTGQRVRERCGGGYGGLVRGVQDRRQDQRGEEGVEVRLERAVRQARGEALDRFQDAEPLRPGTQKVTS